MEKPPVKESQPEVKEKTPRVRKKSFVEEVQEGVASMISLQNDSVISPLNMPQPDVLELGDEIERKKNRVILEYLLKYESISSLKDIASQKLKKLKLDAKNLDIKSLKKKIDDYTQTSEYARQADKVYYLIGCSITFVTIFILGKFPGTFYFYWLAFIEISMLLKRCHLYFHLKWEYFLIDYCYFCNIVMLIYIFFFPGSRFLSIFMHSMSFGVLSYSLFCFKNSFIFHHLDKLTDLVIHLLPIVTMWNIRYNIGGTEEFKQWGFCDLSEVPFSFGYIIEAFSAANKMYLSHACFYYFLVCVVLRTEIFEKGKNCLLKYTTENSPTALRWHKTYGLWARCLLFAINHYLYATGMTILSIPAFFSEYFAFIQLFFYLFVIVKNGADYYFSYFSKKYESKLQELDELETAQKAAAS
ncbi:unnamed protein product [Moneuplotes crassus]|uniref:Glycerophosphocholine acyltransferase 1 n=1 Tax=Euplotes crassus TaxID=5936 RepID=A0AAD1UCZ3_EUPCR|nr:unnamed protein product [Moneuplotes crassus]